MSGVDDVRDVLTFYSQQDDPIEAFKINQARLQVRQENQRPIPVLQYTWGFLNTLSHYQIPVPAALLLHTFGFMTQQYRTHNLPD